MELVYFSGHLFLISRGLFSPPALEVLTGDRFVYKYLRVFVVGIILPYKMELFYVKSNEYAPYFDANKCVVSNRLYFVMIWYTLRCPYLP